MNATRHLLDKLIAEARDRLRKAERDAQNARIEIATLEKAKVVVGESTIAGRRRALSESWRDVLVKIGKDGRPGATLDQIHVYCRDAGLNIERQRLRAQMANYVNRGYLERVQEGLFRLTSAGDKAARIVSFVRGNRPAG